MTTAHKITLAFAVVLAAVLVYAGYGWLGAHDAALTLQTQQKADSDNAAKITASESTNQAQLASSLAALGTMRQQVQTPAQVVQALPQVITLPAPVVQVTQAQAKAADALPDAPQIHTGDLIIPQEDVKPFYDAQLDCKVNATKLSSCGETVTNLTALGAVKDTEIKQQEVVIKGGTKWQLIKRAAKWSAVGAVVGAVAVAVLTHK